MRPHSTLLVIFVFLSASVAACDRAGESSSDGRAAVTDQAESAPAPPMSPAPSVGFDASGNARAARQLESKVSDIQVTGGSSLPGTSGAGQSGTVAPSMIIRTGHASLEVDSLESAIAQVRRLAERVGGYVANSSTQTGRDQVRSATLELKIPAARFDEAAGGLDSIGKVEAVNVSAEDVGEEFVDLTARVTNARRLEERLITLLATRTGKLEDVLAVERELARVREEIERYDGRLRFLRTRVAVSTLSVTVHEPAPIVGGSPGANPILDAVRAAWRNFVHFIAALIASLGVLIPVAVLAVLAWLVIRRWLPRRRPPVREEPGEPGISST